MRVFLLRMLLIATIVHSTIQSTYQPNDRVKRQIYYRDISNKPKLYRSRPDEKDNTERTGHLPISPHYPAPYDPVHGTAPYSGNKHEKKPTPIYYDPDAFHHKPVQEEEHLPPHQPIHEENFHKLTHQSKPHGSRFSYQESPYKKPSYHQEIVHEDTQYRPRPHSSYKPKPTYEEPYHRPKPTYHKPVHEEPYHKPKPVYEEPYHKPKPVYEEPYHKPKPVYEEPYHKPKPSYEEPIYHEKPHKKKNSIPGEPGIDYPIYNEVPYTSFSCSDVPYRPGMYANPEAHCQAYHVCNDDRHGPQGASFLCTNGTLFNQKTFSCDWWNNVDCSNAKKYYDLNTDPKHNPYFQKPYEEEIHYKQAPSEYKEQKSSYRKSGSGDNYKAHKPRPTFDSQPTYSTSSQNRQHQTITSPFDPNFKRGSFFESFSFNEPQEKQHSLKREVVTSKSKAEVNPQPLVRISKPEINSLEDLNESRRRLNSAQTLPFPQSHEVQPRRKSNLPRTPPAPRRKFKDPPKEDNFPRSKDIYSRVVANERANRRKSYATSNQKDDNEEKFDLDEALTDFEWGEKLQR